MTDFGTAQFGVTNPDTGWWQDVNNLTYRTFPAFAGQTASQIQLVNNSLASRGVCVTDPPYNADPTGATDSTAAIQAAMNSATYGSTVYLPSGTFLYTALTIPLGVRLVGQGVYASTLLCTVANGVIFMNASTQLQELQIASNVTQTGFTVNVQGNGVTLRDVQFKGYFIGVSIGTIGGFAPSTTIIEDCVFFNPVIATGSGAIQALNFRNTVIDGCVISGPAFPGTQPDFGIRFENGDTAFVSDTNVTLHGKALNLDIVSNSNCYGLSCSNCFFDSAGTISNGIAQPSASINPATSAGVYNTKFGNCWFGLSKGGSGCSVLTTGAGTVDGLSFTGCEFPANGDCGLIVVGPNAKNWVVSGGGSGGNINSGIRAAGGTSYFTITGHVSGGYSGRGSNAVGVTVDSAASDYYLISSNNVLSSTSSIVDGGTGQHAQVYQNAGYNGASSLIGLTVTGSPWSYTAGHTPETIYIIGGTVSSVAIDGQTIQNTTGGTVPLVPNETMTITYSALPTVLRKKA